MKRSVEELLKLFSKPSIHGIFFTFNVIVIIFRYKVSGSCTYINTCLTSECFTSMSETSLCTLMYIIESVCLCDHMCETERRRDRHSEGDEEGVLRCPSGLCVFVYV